VLEVILPHGTIDEDIIKKDKYKLAKEGAKNINHGGLKC
jgi:hypothetical protein